MVQEITLDERVQIDKLNDKSKHSEAKDTIEEHLRKLGVYIHIRAEELKGKDCEIWALDTLDLYPHFDFLVSEDIIVQVEEYGHNSLIAYYFSYNKDQIKPRERLPSYGHFGICKYEGDNPIFYQSGEWVVMFSSKNLL